MKKILGYKKEFAVLLAIMLAAVFLRTYNFHAWLGFELDQVRDASFVSQVIDGKAPLPEWGPTMRKSGESKDNLFHLGPIYYYFQIASAKIFGNYPDHLAYPDLFFSLLTIVLFYFFVRKFFSANVSLAVTAAWAFSYFAIRYARFAWNPNSIPFFSLLFLYSLHEFYLGKEKTKWIWVALLGASIGVAVQLHLILFLLLPAVTFLVFGFLLKENPQVWKKMLTVVLLVLVFNLAPLISELKTGFANTRVLLHSSAGSSKDGIATKLANDLDCHVEASGQILTSLGSDQCNFNYQKTFTLPFEKNVRFAKKLHDPIFSLALAVNLFFAVLGAWSLVYFFRKEKQADKKAFLGLIILYAALSFAVMYPVINSDLTEFRYFIHAAFLPFIFLGFIFSYLEQKTKKYAAPILAVLVLVLALSNFWVMAPIIQDLNSKTRTDAHLVVLGEAEKMAEYLLASSGKQTIYLTGDQEYISNLLKPLQYLTEKQNVDIVQTGPGIGYPQAPGGAPLYFLTHQKPSGEELKNFEVQDYQEFGKIGIYKLNN